jgi:hypothetical protein
LPPGPHFPGSLARAPPPYHAYKTGLTQPWPVQAIPARTDRTPSVQEPPFGEKQSVPTDGPALLVGVARLKNISCKKLGFCRDRWRESCDSPASSVGGRRSLPPRNYFLRVEIIHIQLGNIGERAISFYLSSLLSHLLVSNTGLAASITVLHTFR